MFRRLNLLVAVSLLAKLGLQGTPVEVIGKNSSNQLVDMNSCYTASCGQCDDKTWYLTSPDYTLTSVTIWPNGNNFRGVQLHYVDSLGQTLSSPILGSSSGSTPNSYTVTKKVVGITMKINGPNTSNTKQYISGFYLHYVDTTTLTVGPIQTADLSYYSPLEVGLLGLRCNFHEKPHGQTAEFDSCFGCVPYDIPCSTLTFDSRTFTNMAVLVTQSQS